MRAALPFFFFFFFNDTATTEIYTLSLHDALPILCACVNRGNEIGPGCCCSVRWCCRCSFCWSCGSRSEEHTSELQSQSNLVCRLLLEKKKQKAENLDFVYAGLTS